MTLPSSELHLVTGGTGYFGSLLATKLHAEGHAVRVFDQNPSVELPAGIEQQIGDVTDPGAVERALSGCAVAYHNVALVPLAKDHHAFWRVNLGGTHNLLEAARRHGTRKIVFTSSSAVFGDPERNPVTESTIPRPREAYGRAKLAAEGLCHEYAERGLDVSVVRPRTILGHGRLGILQILFEWIRQGRNVPVLGRGDNLYQFVHADDLANACIRAALHPGPRTYNIGGLGCCTMRETLEALVAHAGTGSRVRSIPRIPAEWGMRATSALGVSPLGAYHALMYGRSLYFDTSLAERELGWGARYGNREMIIESYDWYLRHRVEVLARVAASPHRSPVRQGVLALVARLL